MKIIIIISIILCPFFFYGQTNNPFLELRYDKVVVYDYAPLGEKGGLIVDLDGKIARSILKSVVLDSKTTSLLNRKLGEKKSYGGTTAFCFDPHLGIVYYLRDKIVAHVSVCFSCNRLRSSIDIPAQKQGRVGENEEVYYLADGLSKIFRSFLNGIAKKYNFTHQIEAGSAFDK